MGTVGETRVPEEYPCRPSKNYIVKKMLENRQWRMMENCDILLVLGSFTSLSSVYKFNKRVSHDVQYITYIAHTLLHLPKPAQLLEGPTLPRSFLTAAAMSLRLSVMKRSRHLSWWILNSRGLVFPVWKDFLALCTASCSLDILHTEQTIDVRASSSLPNDAQTLLCVFCFCFFCFVFKII